MLDDFHDAYAFMEWREYGELKVFNAFCTNGKEPNHGGDIGVFLNFKLVGKFKKKSEALELVRKLIAEAPSKDFEKYDTITQFLE